MTKGLGPQSAIILYPSKLGGKIDLPPSKSLSHRAAICSALTQWQNGCFRDPLFGAIAPHALSDGDDVRYTTKALQALSFWLAHHQDVDFASAPCVVQCGESGSTLRFLIPLALAMGIPTLFEGKGKLPFRPIAALNEAFQTENCGLRALQPQAYLPLQTQGKWRQPHLAISGLEGSQPISGLLMAAPLLHQTVYVTLTSAPVSRSYIELTRSVMADFGVETQFDAASGPYGTYIIPKQFYRWPKQAYTIRPDASSAAFWLVAKQFGATIEFVGACSLSAQADAVLPMWLAVLRRGVSGSAFSLRDCPDLAPVFALALAKTPGLWHLDDCARLRTKECDRLEAIQALLRYLGIHYEYHETTQRMSIVGQSSWRAPAGDPPTTHGDHRMVMTQVVAHALLSQDIGTCTWRIDQPWAVGKSYPNFWRDYALLGGRWSD